tara:strand:- start:91057 stop:91518 length:462 start_codon:yes stop_codon:yes gene_type:complete
MTVEIPQEVIESAEFRQLFEEELDDIVKEVIRKCEHLIPPTRYPENVERCIQRASSNCMFHIEVEQAFSVSCTMDFSPRINWAKKRLDFDVGLGWGSSSNRDLEVALARINLYEQCAKFLTMVKTMVLGEFTWRYLEQQVAEQLMLAREGEEE